MRLDGRKNNCIIEKQRLALGWAAFAGEQPQPRKRKLVLATTNRGKVVELRELLSGLPYEILSLADFPQIPPVVEDGETFSENAVRKAEATYRYTGEMAIADDSGLEVDSLDGRPGVRSARFAGEQASDAENNALLLQAMAGVPPEQRGATFICVIALARPGLPVITVEGRCRGRIAAAPQGTGGFGYDPLFIPEGEARTFAGMDRESKSRISHRGQAMQKMKAILAKLP